MPGERQSNQHPVTRGLRSAVRNDATAFSFSITITVTFGLVQLEIGSPSIARLFLFVAGSTGAFAAIEAATSRLFQVRMREDPSDVVILGTALAPLSVGVALASAAGVVEVVRGSIAWFAAPAVATTVYIAMAALQLAFARRYEAEHPPEEDR